MKCLRCKSVRIVSFIDGFGEKRIFCRTCWGSFPTESVIKFSDQKSLQEFNHETYNKLKFHDMHLR
ncbi:MAG: hypothetical protein HY361_01320 [Candidatus Aenigmarchaeota archaeon]|nr:hypothetical protein [Candidatus Aenigmarchaeota archaeon]